MEKETPHLSPVSLQSANPLKYLFADDLMDYWERDPAVATVYRKESRTGYSRGRSVMPGPRLVKKEAGERLDKEAVSASEH